MGRKNDVKDELEYMFVHFPTLRALAQREGMEIDERQLRVLRLAVLATNRINNAKTVLRRSYHTTRSPERVLSGLQRTRQTLAETSAAGALEEERTALINLIDARIDEIKRQILRQSS